MRDLPQKIIYVGDSTTANSSWNCFKLPTNTAHLSAEKSHYYNWEDETSISREWPDGSGRQIGKPGLNITSDENLLTHTGSHIVKEITRDENSVAYACTHIAQALDVMIAEKTHKGICHAFPMQVHSYHPCKEKEHPFQLPSGFTVRHLPLTQADADEIARAAKLTAQYHNAPTVHTGIVPDC